MAVKKTTNQKGASGAKTTAKTKAAPKKAVAKNEKKANLPTVNLQLGNLKNRFNKVNFQTSKKWVVTHKVAVFSTLVVLALVLVILPHLAVAWVDNKPITIFEYYNALDSKYGKDEKQQLIAQKLVESEAQKRGISVSDAEVNLQFQQVEDQASGSANLQSLLAQQGLTIDDFKTQLRLQSLIKKMFSDQATVSAQEVEQYIQQNKDQYPQDDDATKAQVTQQLSQQKLVSAFQDWLQTAEQSNRVAGL